MVLGLNLNEEEKKQLKIKAIEEGVSATELIRKRILRWKNENQTH